MAWAGIYSGSAFQLRLQSRALQFPETSNWQWRAKQHTVSTVLIIKGPPFNIHGWGEVFVAEELFISTRLGGALNFSKFYHMFIMFISNI